MQNEKINLDTLLVGGDPEFFLLNTKTGAFVSAHDLLPGTKEAPHKMDCGHVQVDGTAVEFNIDPAKNEDEFVQNVYGAIDCIRQMLPAHLEFKFTPYVEYHPTYFKKLPTKCVELGCNPDYSGYTFQQNPVPFVNNPTLRTAAGHVTIGFTDLSQDDSTSYEHIMTCGRIARNLDITLGLASLAWDRDRVRRTLYGKAGAYRPKPFGIEYRVLSNSWLKDAKYVRQVYRGAIAGVRDFFENDVNCMFMQRRMDEVVTAINTGSPTR